MLWEEADIFGRQLNILVESSLDQTNRELSTIACVVRKRIIFGREVNIIGESSYELSFLTRALVRSGSSSNESVEN